MTHVRWAAKLDAFPSDYYQFSQVLIRLGDFVRTPPLNKKDRKKFLDAAYAWAWRRKWRVSCESFRVAEAMWEVECTLIAFKHVRLYDY